MPRKRRTDREAERLYQRLGAEIEKAFTTRGWSQRQLGDAIGEAQTTVSDYKQAKVRVPLDVVVAIEDALGLTRGELLIDAGYVDVDALATTLAIERDLALDDGFRQLLLDLYRFAVERSATDEDLPLAERTRRLNEELYESARPPDPPAGQRSAGAASERRQRGRAS